MRFNINNNVLTLIAWAVFINLALISCGSSIDPAEREDFAELQSLIESRRFEIENNWALPIGGGNINLIGNPNYLRFKGDSIEVRLPFFGVRHSGGNYGSSEGGIVYEGTITNLEIIENPSKAQVDMRFEANDESENYDFIITLYSNNKARTQVNSSQRSNISYEGDFRKLKEQ